MKSFINSLRHPKLLKALYFMVSGAIQKHLVFTSMMKSRWGVHWLSCLCFKIKRLNKGSYVLKRKLLQKILKTLRNISFKDLIYLKKKKNTYLFTKKKGVTKPHLPFLPSLLSFGETGQVFQDSAVALPPLNANLARKMLQEISVFAILLIF